MYGLVERMDSDLAYQLAHRCYREMVRAGIRTVGEFHYLRHNVFSDSNFVLDEAVIHAANDAEIELVLLPAAYEEGGPGASSRASPSAIRRSRGRSFNGPAEIREWGISSLLGAVRSVAGHAATGAIHASVCAFTSGRALGSSAESHHGSAPA